MVSSTRYAKIMRAGKSSGYIENHICREIEHAYKDRAYTGILRMHEAFECIKSGYIRLCIYSNTSDM